MGYAEKTRFRWHRALLQSPDFSKRVFAPDDEHRDYRIKFLDVRESGPLAVFESAAEMAGIKMTARRSKRALKG